MGKISEEQRSQNASNVETEAGIKTDETNVGPSG